MWKGDWKKTRLFAKHWWKNQRSTIESILLRQIDRCFSKGFACQSWRLPTCLLCFFSWWFRKTGPQKFGNIAGTGPSLGAKCFHGCQWSNICWGLKLAPLGFKVQFFLRPGFVSSAMIGLLIRRPRTWEHELIWKVSPCLFFANPADHIYCTDQLVHERRISEASTHQLYLLHYPGSSKGTHNFCPFRQK